jgi:hypothetical protein
MRPWTARISRIASVRTLASNADMSFGPIVTEDVFPALRGEHSRPPRFQGARCGCRPVERGVDPRASGVTVRAFLGGLAPADRFVRADRNADRDSDGIYAPGDFNDRLLLGLKETMSEAELASDPGSVRRRAAQQGRARRAGDAFPGGGRPRRGRTDHSHRRRAGPARERACFALGAGVVRGARSSAN